MLRRQEYRIDLTKERDPIRDKRSKVAEGKGNLYSSELVGQPGYHVPTLDIDLECELHPSTNEGHFHLYIDKPMVWEDYYHLMQTLCDVGIIQKGFFELSIARGASFLRKPGVTKNPDETRDS